MSIYGTLYNTLFLEPGYNLDKKEAVLEPSYICEALGIQGRLDYMQRDMSSFIEMKSGKADEFSMQGKVEPKENNKVQMLLYMAVLEYSMGTGPAAYASLFALYPLSFIVSGQSIVGSGKAGYQFA